MTNTLQHTSKLELSVRRKEIKGLPGDDSTLHNLKIGSSLRGRGPLRGLEFDEELKYLPEIIGISPNDQEWRKATQEYWNNISVKVPADGVTTSALQGLPLTFIISFENAKDKEAFDKVISFVEKAELSKKGTVVDGLHDYVLWRYCLVYGKVANRFEDVRKSAKILFYLYSKETETLVAHKAFKARMKAQNVFATLLDKESTVDAVLLMFDQDLSAFETAADKHLALDALVKSKPAEFLLYAEDTNLQVKSFIRKAVDKQIIKNPKNTESYYYGENNEVLIGSSLEDAVIYCKSPEEKNKQIVASIKARLTQN